MLPAKSAKREIGLVLSLPCLAGAGVGEIISRPRGGKSKVQYVQLAIGLSSTADDDGERHSTWPMTPLTTCALLTLRSYRTASLPHIAPNLLKLFELVHYSVLKDIQHCRPTIA
jgi:hypothetical protein